MNLLISGHNALYETYEAHWYLIKPCTQHAEKETCHKRRGTVKAEPLCRLLHTTTTKVADVDRAVLEKRGEQLRLCAQSHGDSEPQTGDVNGSSITSQEGWTTWRRDVRFLLPFEVRAFISSYDFLVDSIHIGCLTTSLGHKIKVIPLWNKKKKWSLHKICVTL